MGFWCGDLDFGIENMDGDGAWKEIRFRSRVELVRITRDRRVELIPCFIGMRYNEWR